MIFPYVPLNQAIELTALLRRTIDPLEVAL